MKRFLLALVAVLFLSLQVRSQDQVTRLPSQEDGQVVAMNNTNQYLIRKDFKYAVWLPNERVNLRSIPAHEGSLQSLTAISDTGIVCGTTSQEFQRSVVVWNIGANRIDVVYKAPRLKGGDAHDIDSLGERIVGTFDDKACIWTRDGDGWEMTFLPSQGNTEARGISSDGRYVAGFNDTTAYQRNKPCVWVEKASGWSQTILPARFGGEGLAINDRGEAVGKVWEGKTTRGFFWSIADGFVLLDKPDNYVDAVATDISNDGIVVGYAEPPQSYDKIGFVWSKERGTNLLFPSGVLCAAQCINNKNIIGGLYVADDGVNEEAFFTAYNSK